MGGLIRIDVTPAVALVYCRCGFRELASTREGARRVAAWHEASCHPEHGEAREALKYWRPGFTPPRGDTGTHDERATE